MGRKALSKQDKKRHAQNVSSTRINQIQIGRQLATENKKIEGKKKNGTVARTDGKAEEGDKDGWNPASGSHTPAVEAGKQAGPPWMAGSRDRDRPKGETEPPRVA